VICLLMSKTLRALASICREGKEGEEDNRAARVLVQELRFYGSGHRLGVSQG
jgi:hypothetical protein